MSGQLSLLILFGAMVAAFALVAIRRSVVVIGPAEVGLVIKRVSRFHNATDFNG